MKCVQLPIKWLDAETGVDLELPVYQSAKAAGMDVHAAISAPMTLAPGEIALLPSGFAVAIPDGYEMQVRPRSGLAVKHGVTVVNSPGTIDADYRGEVKIGLINLSHVPFTIQRGDRIAQLILAPVCQADLQLVAELDDTQRSSGGFGHTGV